jgi:ATP-binding cassette subfamily F protein 2
MGGDAEPPTETKAERKARTKKEAQERKARRKAERAAKKGGVVLEDGAADAPEAPTDADITSIEQGDAGALTAEQQRVAAVRAVTGVLASSKEERDVKFDAFSVMVGGNQLITDCRLELSQGHRYGLIGENGSGKSNILASIAQGDVPLPDHIDVFHLHEEAPASEMTGVEAVINHIVEEAAKLEKLAERIMEESGMEDERLSAIYDRLDELDPTGSEPRARLILSGLGFCDRLIPMDRKTKHMSGGWRMRVSLAKALFAAPSLLLLDEPTNHLDLEACVWLEEHLSSYPKCLLVVSHSEDFLNSVCTDTIWLKPNPFHLSDGPGSKGAKLRYYGGNYDTFVRVVGEEERVHVRAYEKQQADLQKLADFVRINKANGKANAAKSKKKVMEKILENAVEKPQVREPTLTFVFPETEPLVRCDGPSSSLSPSVLVPVVPHPVCRLRCVAKCAHRSSSSRVPRLRAPKPLRLVVVGR